MRREIAARGRPREGLCTDVYQSLAEHVVTRVLDGNLNGVGVRGEGD